MVNLPDGFLNVQLGKVNLLDPTNFNLADVYLEIQISLKGIDWETLASRQKSNSTACAMRAAYADHKDVTNSSGATLPGVFVGTSHSGVGTSKNVNPSIGDGDSLLVTVYTISFIDKISISDLNRE